MISSGINLVMTVIGFAVSTMFIVFVCTRLICARIQLHASRRSLPISSRSDLSLLERGLHGLEPLVIANFPTKKYGDIRLSPSEDARCTVCLSEYQEEDVLRILPYCGHSFHSMCVDKWLQQNSTCPVCRISLRELPDKKRMQPMYSSAVLSHYGLEPVCPTSYRHLSANSSRSSRAPGNHRIESAQEYFFSRFSSESDGGGDGGVGGGANISRQTTKDSGNNQVESPSNI